MTVANGVQRTTSGSWPSVYAQGYSYDRWGNRSINAGATWGTNIYNTVITPNTANNRLNGMTYDAAGNLTNDPITGAGTRTYDAENRMISAQGGGTNYYVYDADGKRVRRIVGGMETWQVYGFSGELIAEYPVNGATGSPNKEYANGGQTMIVGDTSNVRWTVTDALGTPRIVVGKNGGLADVTRHDYLPFGEELYVGMGTGSIRTTTMGYAVSGTNDGLRKKFTGYERDDETGLDYAQARYYSSKQGRFTSPDEFTGGPDELYDFADDVSEKPMLYAELTDPQSFNKYQYCYNNPLSLIDPDGHKTWAEWARIGLEVATYIPGPIGTVASAVQAVDKLVQGDYAGAAQSALGAVPGAKLVRAGARVIDKAADGSKAIRSLVSKGNEGIARVRQFNLEGGPHVSVEVIHKGKSLQTDQVIINSQKGTTIRQTQGLPKADKVVDVKIPNARAAMKKQKESIGTDGGKYDKNTNSCVTHACDILRAGGVNAPKTTREGVRFIRKQGKEANE